MAHPRRLSARWWWAGHGAAFAWYGATLVALNGSRMAESLRGDWVVWTTGKVGQSIAPAAVGNALHSPWYLAACGLWAAWSASGMGMGWPRMGLSYLLGATLFSSAYFSTDGHVLAAWLPILAVVNFAVQPWRDRERRSPQPTLPQDQAGT